MTWAAVAIERHKSGGYGAGAPALDRVGYDLGWILANVAMWGYALTLDFATGHALHSHCAVGLELFVAASEWAWPL